MDTTVARLADTTVSLFGVSKEALFSTNRTARVAEARAALAWALRQRNWSLESIGDYLRRDHTTIIHSLKAVERRARHDARLRDQLETLTQPATPQLDWQARIEALEQRIAELEARLR